MKNSFSVNYKDQEIMIEPIPGDQHGNLYYVAHLPGENIRIEYTEDDEGAGHWLDELANHETELSAALGHLIDRYNNK